MTTRNKLTWRDPSPTISAPDFTAALELHSLTARILAQRGFSTLDSARAFLFPEHYSPTLPHTLPDLCKTAARLERAIDSGEKVLVWGDFDVDGQTATALLVDGLRQLGANVAFYIPHRLRESHGIRIESLREQLEIVRPVVLLTCDTGVSAYAGIDYAKSRGVATLITDHHDLPPELPDADAVVNPKRLPVDHALASLPGVGVAYKLIEELYTRRSRSAELPQFLDLVALGIVADVAEQTRDTRYLLQIGLERLRTTQRTGLQALIEVAGLNSDRLNATDIGFQIGPRLNAAGRLDDARPAVELLTTTDPTRAQLLAQQLEGLNNQRRLQTDQIYIAVQEQIARDPSLLDWEALVLAHPTWHAGIIGIVASRLAEQYARPVVLLNSSNPERARGSARSAPGYDIGASIAAQADLLLEHGGHPGAAGLSLHADNIPAFRRRLSNTLRATRDPSIRPGLDLDAYVSLNELSLDLVRELNRLAPFGEGNPRITLATRDLTLKSAAFLGRTKAHRRLTVEDANGTRHTVLWWNSADQPLPDGLFDLAYQLEINTFRDQTELQLVLVDYRRSESAPVEIERPRRQVTDLRYATNPEQQLADLRQQYPDAAIWAEGYRHVESPGIPLSKLAKSSVLVIHTTPGGPQALQEALECADPAHVVLIAIDPPLRAAADIFSRLMQLVKYVINQQAGRTTLSALAEAVAQRPQTIQYALDHLAARGEIAVEYKRGGGVVLAWGNHQPGPDADVQAALAAFQAGVTETAAYRAYFRRADAHKLAGEESEI